MVACALLGFYQGCIWLYNVLHMVYRVLSRLNVHHSQVREPYVDTRGKSLRSLCMGVSEGF